MLTFHCAPLSSSSSLTHSRRFPPHLQVIVAYWYVATCFFRWFWNMTECVGSDWWSKRPTTGRWWTLFLPYCKCFCECFVPHLCNSITVSYVSSRQRTSTIWMMNLQMTSLLQLCSLRNDPPLHVDLSRRVWRVMLCWRCVFFFWSFLCWYP